MSKDFEKQIHVQYIKEKIPLTQFDAVVKQLSTADLPPDFRQVFNYLLPHWQETTKIEWSDELHRYSKAGLLSMRMDHGSGDIDRFTRRYRRFGGETDLPRERYSTICFTEEGDDDGTLVNEIRTYHDPILSGCADFFDLSVKKFKAIHDSIGMPASGVDQFVVLLRSYAASDRLPDVLKHALNAGNSFIISIPLTIKQVSIDRVLDLRNPEAATWFARTFGSLELDFGPVKYRPFLNRPTVSSFREVLPETLVQDLGGGGFTQIAGEYLRLAGINGLVFPSARSNCSVSVVDGAVASYAGWNFVDYRGRNIELAGLYDTDPGWMQSIGSRRIDPNPLPKEIGFGDTQIFFDESPGRKGSWQVMGLEEAGAAISAILTVEHFLRRLNGKNKADCDGEAVKQFICRAPGNQGVLERFAPIRDALLGSDMALNWVRSAVEAMPDCPGRDDGLATVVYIERHMDKALSKALW